MKALSISLLLAATAASAAPRRIAVVVGANQGALGRSDLRYSYRDAQDVADALVQVGEFAPQDVHVLQDPAPETVLATLDHELARLRTLHGESMLLFYYSGHADGGALYPAGKALSFADLRTRLESDAATIRVGIIDACSGGAWTGAKGLHPAPPFAVHVPLELSGEGSVLIASSSGVETAHESGDLLGSYFTHHLVAALRGAADRRGDGVVTVTDAFAYAKERTIRDSAAVSMQPQHPSFFMNLRGRADLALARVDTSPTVVDLEETEGPLQLIHLSTGVVVLEVPEGRRALKLSVPPGRYLLRREGPQGNYAREVSVEAGKSVRVREEDLQLTGIGERSSKRWASTSEGWPLALNDRPLTLYKGLAQFDIGLLLTEDNRPLARDTSPAIEGALRYGLTDRITLSFSAPGGICLGSQSCTNYVTMPGGQIDVGVVSSRWGDVAATIGIGNDPQGNAPILGGFVARVQGGPLALVLAPQLRYHFTNGPTYWSYQATGQLVVQALERLSFDAGVVLRGSFDVPSPFDFDPRRGTGGVVPLTLGTTFAFGRHFDARAQVTFANLQARGTVGPGDFYTLGFALSVRP